MTIPFGVSAILSSALKKFPEKDIRRVLSRPYGIETDYPRVDVMAIGGFTSGGIPIVVLVDMETNEVFHSQRWEAKYRRLLG